MTALLLSAPVLGLILLVIPTWGLLLLILIPCLLLFFFIWWYMLTISKKNEIELETHQNELRRQLTQNISHELKTPVSSILGYLESIRNNPQLDEDKKNFFLERTYNQAQRLSILLQDISTLNKLDDTHQLFQRVPVDISEIISEVNADIQLLLQKNKSTIAYTIPDKCSFLGNRNLLFGIFRNLIENAIMYAGEGRFIEVKLLKDTKESYEFCVQDNGKGVKEEHLERLFERFYRLDKGRSRMLGGTGLGLSIVKNAVLYHGGTIKVENRTEGGLKFTFTLQKNHLD